MKVTSSKIYFNGSNNIKLTGRFYKPLDSEVKTWVIIVPGFTQLRLKRYIELQKYLAHNNIGSFVFDYCVLQNDKVGQRAKLADLIEDTKLALSMFQRNITGDHIYVLGYSIGGYIAPFIIDNMGKLSGLILVSPPAYSTDSCQKPVATLSQEINKPALQNKKSKIFDKIKLFDKKIMIVFGDEDKEILPEIKLMFKNLENNILKYVNLNGGVHSLLRDRSPQEKIVSNKLFEVVSGFILENR